MRIILRLVFLGILTASCHLSSPIFTPDPKDPAYPCHDENGAAAADYVWCFPVDHSHTCCRANFTCGTLEGEPSCSYQGNPDNGSNGAIGSAQKSVPRMPESGRP
jgi:hypothetical protein